VTTNSVQIPQPAQKLKVLKVRRTGELRSSQGSNNTLLSIRKMKENQSKNSNMIVKKTNPSDMLRII
jgi:hypothetical protein